MFMFQTIEGRMGGGGGRGGGGARGGGGGRGGGGYSRGAAAGVPPAPPGVAAQAQLPAEAEASIVAADAADSAAAEAAVRPLRAAGVVAAAEADPGTHGCRRWTTVSS